MTDKMAARPVPSGDKWTVFAADQGQRLDKLVARQKACSVAEARRMIAAGQVFVDGKKAAKGRSLRPGQSVQCRSFLSSDAQVLPAIPAFSRSGILYRDDRILVVNKPAGLPAQARSLGAEDCLVQRLSRLMPELADIGDDPREGALLHRLDVGTSGAIALATSAAHFLALRRSLRSGGVDKFYLALVHDRAQAMPRIGRIDWQLAHAGRSGRMVVIKTGRERYRGQAMKARTAFCILQRGGGLNLVMLLIRQGRMHQIRAHLAALGFAIYADPVYGEAAADFSHQALHAWVLDLHRPPMNGQNMPAINKTQKVIAPVPDDFWALCRRSSISCKEPDEKDFEILLNKYNSL